MRKLIVIILVLFTVQATAQSRFPSLDSLRRYINRYITNSAINAFTDYRLNTALNGMLLYIDSAGSGGSGSGVDSIYGFTDSSFKWRKGLSLYTVTLKGGADVDTLWKDGDSVRYKINGRPHALLGGSTFILYNALGGTGDTLVNADKEVKWSKAQFPVTHVVTGTTITTGVDTGSTGLATQYDLSQISSGGITTMQPIGSVPNANGATISGANLTLQPASRSFGGVVTTDTQSVAGRKKFIDPTTVQGYSPRLNSQWMPGTKIADSIYVSGKYVGFGFIDILPSGTYVIVYNQSDNHVGANMVAKITKSRDQGRTWSTGVTIDAGTGGGTVAGVGGGGITQTGRIVAFISHYTTTPTTIDQRVVYSDDEGVTWSTPVIVSGNSETQYQPYGGLCKIGSDSLLLSFYGNTGSTYSSYVVKSGDNGATWGSPITVFSNTASQRTESMFAYLGGNTLIGLLRGEPNDTLYAQVRSIDNGTTWQYQGSVNWGQQGTPAWLKTFDQNGDRIVAAYHRMGSNIRVIYGYADSLLNSYTKWDINTIDTIATDVQGSGYITVMHPYDNMYFIGYHYDEIVPQTTATIKFVLKKDKKLPIGGFGIQFNLTQDRIAISGGPNSIVDYANFKVDNSTSSIVLNGGTNQPWSGHNGGVVTTGNTAYYSSGSVNSMMNNLYLGGVGPDYRYTSNAMGSTIILESGRLHFYHAPAGTADAAASLTQPFAVFENGDIVLNGGFGTPGQVAKSAGSGSATTWGNDDAGPWVVNGGGNGINYGGTEFVGIHSSTPRAPLDINANTSSNQYTQIISDNNSLLGSTLAMHYTGGSTGQKTRVQWVDGNGHNWGIGPDNLATGGATLQMNLSPSGELHIGNDADAGAFKLQNYGGLYQSGIMSLNGTGAGTGAYKFLVKNTDSTVAQIDKNGLVLDSATVGGFRFAGRGFGGAPSITTSSFTTLFNGSNLTIFEGVGTTTSSSMPKIRLTGSATSTTLDYSGILESLNRTPLVGRQPLLITTTGAGIVADHIAGSIILRPGTSSVTGSNETQYTTDSVIVDLNLSGKLVVDGGMGLSIRGQVAPVGTYTLQVKGTDSVVGQKSVSAFLSDANITGGTYTPTLFNTTNVTSTTAQNATWTRIGNQFHICGSFDVTTTLAVATEVGISLPGPGASAFGSATDMNGVANAESAIATNGICKANVANSRAQVNFLALSVGGSGRIYYTLDYTYIAP